MTKFSPKSVVKKKKTQNTKSEQIAEEQKQKPVDQKKGKIHQREGDFTSHPYHVRLTL